MELRIEGKQVLLCLSKQFYTADMNGLLQQISRFKPFVDFISGGNGGSATISNAAGGRYSSSPKSAVNNNRFSHFFDFSMTILTITSVQFIADRIASVTLDITLKANAVSDSAVSSNGPLPLAASDSIRQNKRDQQQQHVVQTITLRHDKRWVCLPVITVLPNDEHYDHSDQEEGDHQMKYAVLLRRRNCVAAGGMPFLEAASGVLSFRNEHESSTASPSSSDNHPYYFMDDSRCAQDSIIQMFNQHLSGIDIDCKTCTPLLPYEGAAPTDGAKLKAKATHKRSEESAADAHLKYFTLSSEGEAPVALFTTAKTMTRAEFEKAFLEQRQNSELSSYNAKNNLELVAVELANVPHVTKDVKAVLMASILLTQ